MRLDELEAENDRLRKTNAALVNLNDIAIQESKRKAEKITKLVAETARLLAEKTRLTKDWCDDDEDIKKQALRVLPSEVVEGDTWYVPRMGDLAELMADECKRLSALVHMYENTISSREMDLTIRLQDAEAENAKLKALNKTICDILKETQAFGVSYAIANRILYELGPECGE